VLGPGDALSPLAFPDIALPLDQLMVR